MLLKNTLASSLCFLSLLLIENMLFFEHEYSKVIIELAKSLTTMKLDYSKKNNSMINNEYGS